MSLARRRAALAVLAAGWAGTIWWASSRPSPFPFVPQGIFAHDKLLHALAWAVLAALVLGAVASARPPAARAVVLAVALAVAWGAADELHQARVPGRDPDPADLAADAAGAIAGAAAAAVILRRRGARASIAA